MTIDHFDTPYLRQIALWVLRLFSNSSASQLFIKDGDYADADIARFLELPMNPGPGELSEVPKMMAVMLAQLESDGDAALDTSARENLASFNRTLGLDDAEASILTFFMVADIEPVLTDSLRVLSSALTNKSGRILAKVLKLSENEVEAALRKGSRLRAGGLLRFTAHGRGQISNLEFFCSEVAKSLIHDVFDRSRILSVMGVMESDAPLLDAEDYPHLELGLPLLLDYLRNVASSGKRGVNILLYGDPGTGKTQLTRVIAKELNLPLFDFAVCDNDGDPIRTTQRLTSVRIAESFLRDSHALFVFDEFEDILAPSGNDRGLVNERKGWFNRFLETNMRPIFWLSNSIRHLDAAFARRFDLIIEVPVPPRSHREEILRKHAGHQLSSKTIRHLAEVEELAPAVVSRVSGVFERMSGKLPQCQRDEVFSQMVGMTLKAQGHSVSLHNYDEILPTNVYDTACLNTGADLPSIARMLRGHPEARICLHGPPGTGKTAFGHWLAREIDRPLHLKRASDLLSPFVGGTEMQIAGTFEKALRDNAILMIDEVDSFLQDRTKAVRSWEVTQVNELLTRMESFSGVFIATTNRLEHLDAASLRRFDLKVQFDYLNPAQIHELLRAWSRRLGIAPPGDQHRGMTECMECVTPGDFAAVARRHRFQPFTDGGEFLRALAGDCSMKTESTRRIGFLH
jgi:transitional endoplasmic reticulum ATPase